MKKILFLKLLLTFAFGYLFAQQGTLQVYTETSASDFLDGTFSSTTIIGTGVSASIVLSSFTIQWWDQNWRYRRVLYVFNFVTRKLNNFQVLFTTSTKALIAAGKMKNDCSDIRFVAEDNQTVLPHYIESGINTDDTKIWIKISTIPAATSINEPSYIKIYMYYGNPNALSVADGRNVFEVFDDFSSDPRTSGYWDIYDRNQPTSACVWNPTNRNFSLTKNVGGTAGAIFVKNYSLPTSDSWQAKFKYCVTNYNNQPDGGEGFTFMFYKQKFPSGSYPDTGSSLGFTSGGTGPGYGVEFDAVWTGETDVNNAAHFALIKDVTYPHIAGTPYSSDAVRDERWYNVEVTFTNYVSSSNIFVRTIDQSGIAVDRINYTGIFDKTYTSLGFSAASSGNEHLIDDVIVRKYVYPEPVVIDDGEDPKDFYYALGNYRSSVFDCGAPAVISSVTWTATVPPSTFLDVFVFGSTDGVNYNWIKLEKDKELNILTNGSLIEYSVVFYSTVAYLVKDAQGREVLGIRNTPRFDDITFYYRTRSAPLLQLTTFYFIDYNWEMNQFTIYVDFSDSKDLDGQIVKYMWNFGDGEVITTEVPYITHTYFTVPTSSWTFTYTTYTLTLTAFDNDGFYSYINILIPLPATPEILTIPEQPPIEIPKFFPIAKISGENIRIARVNQPITFDCSDSYDVDGDITDVFWWFGDYDTSISSGSFSEFKTVSYTYIDVDTFTVYLFVLDNDFLSSSTTIKVIVRGYPTAKITSSKNIINADKTIVIGYSEKLELKADASYPNGSIVEYIWDFGDGAIIKSTSPVVEYIYGSITSSYTVLLTAIGDDYLISTDSVKVIVSARPIIDVIIPTDCKAGEQIVFDASSSLDIDGSIVSYVWSFGDGTSATGKTVTHIYNKEGSYKVTLVITDNVGLTSSKEFVINVSKRATLQEEISYLDSSSLNIYPVPFRISQKNLNIAYYLNEDADVFVSIYDMFGRIVRNFEFVKGSLGALQGWNTIVWDGVSNSNEFVHSGVYVCKVLIKNKTKKILSQKFIVFR